MRFRACLPHLTPKWHRSFQITWQSIVVFFSSFGTGQLRLVVCVSAPCSVLTRKGYNGVRWALSFLAGLGFVYYPAIISIAPPIFQPLQVKSLSVLIMPKTERRARGWWGSVWVGICRGKRGKERSRREKHLSEERSRRSAYCAESVVWNSGPGPLLKVKGPHCVCWVPLLQLICSGARGHIILKETDERSQVRPGMIWTCSVFQTFFFCWVTFLSLSRWTMNIFV